MSARTVDGELSLRQNVIKQQCVLLRLPTLASQCGPLAEQAERERQPYLGYLEALLAAELEERERRAIDRRIKDAHLPRRASKRWTSSTSARRRWSRRRG